MITYHPDHNIIEMDLTDLEHCGFDHNAFDDELDGIPHGELRKFFSDERMAA